MKLDKNTNYFIECGYDVEQVIEFVERRGGYLNWSTEDLRKKLLRLKGQCEEESFYELGGILLTTEKPLWTDMEGVNDGHLERDWQPLVRIKRIIKKPKLLKVSL
jgi:hypothetical protein